MIIPGFLVSLFTFPGVIVHEMAHQIFCRLFRVAVLDVCYFRLGNPSGYVVHEIPRSPKANIWIGVGPFLVNTVLGALIAAPAFVPVIKFEEATFYDYFLAWLGISIAMHAFPSSGDAKSIWQSTRSPQTPAGVRWAALPVVGLIWIGAVGSIFWLDAIYGMAVAAALPTLLMRLLG